MKIAVFGATGPTGQHLVHLALNRGDEVIVYVRNPTKLSFAHERLQIIQGKLSDELAIEQAIKGVDGVVSILGPVTKQHDTTITIAQGTQHIIHAMKKYNVNRIVAMGTASAKVPQDRFDLQFAFLIALVRLMFPYAYHDIREIAQVLRTSDLDWTLVRVPMLTNTPSTGRIKVGYYGTKIVGGRLAREDMAQFMLDQLTDTRYIKQAPAISN